jgi:formate dehydrogenase maturation protein FdhE
MICSECGKAEYKTINRLSWLAPGEYATVEAEFCKACGDIVYTHAQSLALDKLRREKAEVK